MATTTEERNKELMQTLDDAWNAQDVGVAARGVAALAAVASR